MRPIFNINSNNKKKSFILEKLGGLTYFLHLESGSCEVLCKESVTLEMGIEFSRRNWLAWKEGWSEGPSEHSCQCTHEKND